MNKEEHIEIERRIKTFSPVEALEALSADFFDEQACRRWILKNLHPDGAHCPGCGAEIESEIMIKNFWETRRCQCQECGKWFTSLTNTILHGTQMDMRQIYLLAVLISLRVDDELIAKFCKISTGTVRLWKMRFMPEKKEVLNGKFSFADS